MTYLGREEHFQQEMVFISADAKSSITLPLDKREEGTGNGNPWLLLVLSKTVQMMPRELKKKSGFEPKVFFILFPRSSLLLFMVHYQLKYVGEARAVALKWPAFVSLLWESILALLW